MATVQELLRSGVARLREAGSESPRLDAELLLGHAVGVDRPALLAHPEAPVGADAGLAYEAGLARRAAGEPVAYIRGLKEFYGLAFSVDARALIPRPETERLVELAEREVIRRLAAAPRRMGAPPLRIADVGTGAGTIAVTLAIMLRRRRADTDVAILATDCSAEALAVGRENAAGHGVADRIEFRLADLLPEGSGPFEVLVANLPYVASAAVDGLPVAASFEPRAALDGGPDGLEVVRRLLGRLTAAVTPGGVAFLEIGLDQADAVRSAVADALPGWTCRIESDLGGQPRVAVVAAPAR